MRGPRAGDGEGVHKAPPHLGDGGGGPAADGGDDDPRARHPLGHGEAGGARAGQDEGGKVKAELERKNKFLVVTSNRVFFSSIARTWQIPSEHGHTAAEQTDGEEEEEE